MSLAQINTCRPQVSSIMIMGKASECSPYDTQNGSRAQAGQAMGVVSHPDELSGRRPHSSQYGSGKSRPLDCHPGTHAALLKTLEVQDRQGTKSARWLTALSPGDTVAP